MPREHNIIIMLLTRLIVMNMYDALMHMYRCDVVVYDVFNCRSSFAWICLLLLTALYTSKRRCLRWSANHYRSKLVKVPYWSY